MRKGEGHEPVERADDEARTAKHAEHPSHERERKSAAGKPEDRLQRAEEHADALLDRDAHRAHRRRVEHVWTWLR